MKNLMENPLEQISCFRDLTEHHDPALSAHSFELRSGDILDGRFVIEEPISSSGMGSIYRAMDTQRDNELVAIKVPHMRYESDPAFFSRFQREEEIGCKLDHPYILKFIRVEGKKSRPYIVTEYLRGCTLAHLLGALRPLPEKDALRITSLLCDALQYMHEHGVIHRDLKPGNIMVCRNRTIRIMDFGIARSDDSKRITVAGLQSTMGTPDYMAPEQVTNKQADERTDIYSLGAILYEMLTGSLPFENENSWVAMNNRVNGDPVAPRKLNPEISLQAEEIVLHALQRDRTDRYQTAAEFKAELDVPSKVFVSGYCKRLREPSWSFGFHTTPVLAGTLIGVAFISLQVLAFLLLRHFHPR
jgi:serine/threonine protein kinase